MVTGIFFKIKSFTFVMLLTLVFSSTAMAKNPGKSADYCVRSMGTTITNYCSEKVFIIWCGDMQDSDQQCGSGPKGAYYTHSSNLNPGQREDLKIKPRGNFEFASCFGVTSFGKDKEYKDMPNGDYQCLPK